MIDYLVAHWIKPIRSTTQLNPANIGRFMQLNRLGFIQMVAHLTQQTSWMRTFIHSAQQVRLPLFYPNCFPFRNKGGNRLPNDLFCIPVSLAYLAYEDG